ncbi:uncharacterized protein LOC127241158 [Andrographis paniculata]|uniref:uncharacterized protein LOC127241158 n=1 Tax=Andrographis paniculata TaxID=175694 RepID=UPI0021E95E68|nr:uncharacterized protein LOC127241158 [Andrographis paniculata]
MEQQQKRSSKNKSTKELVDIVFSWSLPNLLNQHLFTHKVAQIPDTFPSGGAAAYHRSFINPLIEETRAQLHSSLTCVRTQPVRQIANVRTAEKLNNRWLHKLNLETIEEFDARTTTKSLPPLYNPMNGDLIALTDVVPKCIDDLNRPMRPYTIAIVVSGEEFDEDDNPCSFIEMVCPKQIHFRGSEDHLFAVYLTNITSNKRIWSALHQGKDANLKIITSVLSYNPTAVEENCAICGDDEMEAGVKATLDSFGLNESQKDAVSNCVALTRCGHRSRVKLIWGPPGTGKTKTVASLVFLLLRMRCKTLICAPTNVAVIGVAKRLMSYLSGELVHGVYGLGDVVVFGNEERMKIDEHKDLFDVFLNHRVKVLGRCLDPEIGWRGTLAKMIRLLDNPNESYKKYKQEEEKDDHNGDIDIMEKVESFEEMLKGDIWKRIVIESVMPKKKRSKLMRKFPRGDVKARNSKCSKGVGGKIIRLSFDEFFKETFFSLGKLLIFSLRGLYTHLPTSFLSIKMVEKMTSAVSMLQEIETQLCKFDLKDNRKRSTTLSKEDGALRVDCVFNLNGVRVECLKELNSLHETFVVNVGCDIRSFCLENAELVFCTASSSAKLYMTNMSLELAIIDEAAQLKECESCIPLQLPSLRHAVLVGDEKQLPAMVVSKICQKARFGRSLFERLVALGHGKHLLNIQYRMHPSISLFPNGMFYENQIKNGPNVMEESYKKCFVRGDEGKLFGTYSFINVSNGKEAFDNSHSRKNIVEVSVVAEIVSILYKESVKTKKCVRVGCISPYKAQVFAIREKLLKKYSADANDAFSVNIQSVDGFQGGEEDIIIISTVCCNGNGSIGFLDNHQRTNVALTRPRFCLWILGDEATLMNSNTIWRKLVVDAKNRDCFYNACDDRNLSSAISTSLIKLRQLDAVFCTESILFKTAKQKVCFDPKFYESIAKIRDMEVHKEVAAVLVKVSNGWRNVKDYSESETSSLECCDLKKQLKLVWSMDAVGEDSSDVRSVRIIDIEPKSKPSKKVDSQVASDEALSSRFAALNLEDVEPRESPDVESDKREI